MFDASVTDRSPVALITGGGSGIGAATAASLRTAGWQVVICGRRRSALDEVSAATGASSIVADVADPEAVKHLVPTVIDRLGRLDGLVLNAGIVRPGPVGDLSVTDWDAMVATNLSAPFRILRDALPHLIESGGSVVGVASMSALRATTGIAGYNATKAGLVMLMQSIAVDYGPLGVRSNVLCPGWTRTEMADGEMAEFASERGIDVATAYQQATALVPLRRVAEADEVAAAVKWLLSSEASYINGAVIPVDGGQAPVDPGVVAFDPRMTITHSA